MEEQRCLSPLDPTAVPVGQVTAMVAHRGLWAALQPSRLFSSALEQLGIPSPYCRGHGTPVSRCSNWVLLLRGSAAGPPTGLAALPLQGHFQPRLAAPCQVPWPHQLKW